ncbi:glycosyl hydrolase 2 galactose-binding domain-containing protein [Streptomyces sp. ID01-9D]|uniref:glycoside hydrolase family 2 protein n=1 Tax=Streptomyces sp. ID01-9D TaxID=3028659 RepID=UPI0029C5DEAB|nr:glycoside hydrolase family 2 protein [Streptomyces sp. ID01-9D]MDX5575119.1 glycoside hydrolase family 2 protein [Streptomyces sp. ID01-9D]
MKVRTPLSQGWTLRLNTDRGIPEDAPSQLAGTTVPAQVPGCVHTDLMAADLLVDPYLDRNESEAAWVGRADWTYATELPRRDSAFERAELVFDGLDTVAAVHAAGQLLGRTRNMHRSYRFDLTDLLAEGPAPLEVAFTSAYTEAEAVREALGQRPNSYPEPFNYVRKMACSFGWDWGPTLVTAGVWREARIEQWSTARLAEVRPQATVAGDGSGVVEITVDLDRTTTGRNRPLRLVATVGDSSSDITVAPGSRSATVTVRTPDVKLWWPRGYGDQPLYECTVALEDGDDGHALDTWERRIGFRTIELDTSQDAHGSAFTLVVNGTPVFARGVNWIPDDVFPTRVTADRYRTRLTQAADAGVDLVRVWGGGIYEDRAFYDTCDELGLMVWQDFLFACAAYPEEQPLRSEIEAEARENVARLMPHPSLVLWNGNNENLWGFADWEWEQELAGASWGEGYYLGLLPRIVAQTDPTRPYWAGSPWSGSWNHTPNDPDHGTTHSWEVWNRRDYSDYLNTVPRFMAEFGWQAPPAHATLERALSERPLTADSPAMLHHQKAEDGNGKLNRGLDHHFAPSADFDTWHYLTQLNQARAVATGVEHWRSHWPRCAGTVLWQLNDCWPVTSWAAIDGDSRLKPLYFEMRRLYADRLLTLQLRDSALVIAGCNQSAATWDTTVTVRRMDADGTLLASAEVALKAAGNSVALEALPRTVTEFGDARREFLVADADGSRAVHFACADREFAYPAASYEVRVSEEGGKGVAVTVTAAGLVRDLVLQSDRLAPDAGTDHGRVTLLPGETFTWHVTGWEGPTAEAAGGALFCVNGAAGRE